MSVSSYLYVGTKESMTDELMLNDSKNAIALLMESMQHASLSGERGWTTSLWLVGESRIHYVNQKE